MTPEAVVPLAAKEDPLYLLLDFAGHRAAFPSGRILLVMDWVPPSPLPLGAPWNVGWHPFEGRAVPVIAPGLIHTGPWEPSLAVLLDAGEHRYFLPGESARFVRGTASRPPAGSPAHALGFLRCTDPPDVCIVDTVLLYRAFHLGYNHALDG